MSAPSDHHADQIEYWNGPLTQRWVDHYATIERIMADFRRALLDGAGAAPGMKALDIGCGCGGSTLALGQQVARSGQVLGLDLSERMIDVARQRATEAGLLRVTFEVADATTYPFPPRGLDVAISSFGVMFFADPVAAFDHLRQALSPGGLLAFVCWQALDRNDWLRVPLEAVRPHLPPAEDGPDDPEAPGPFALADADRLRGVLAAAGFGSVTLDPVEPDLVVAESAEEAARFFALLGPTSARLRDCDDGARARAMAAMVEALETRRAEDGVRLGASAWRVTATPAR
ncbi:MAG: class I SAM-dependent methyltransferase [Sandaracinaceae bacterium]